MIVKIIQKTEVLTNSVLITGANGLIGSSLTGTLLQKGCRVSHLGRSKRSGPIRSFLWNHEKGEFDDKSLEGVDTIVHLAGAGIAEQRWTKARKEEIVNSRVKSTSFLADRLGSHPHTVKTVVVASAIGYYGFGGADHAFVETDGPGSDFLASVVVQWEKEMEKLQLPGIRLVIIRIGIVLSPRGGALKEMMTPVKWGVGAPLGNGKQVMSWIHIDDLCELFSWAIGNKGLHGTFNAVAPNPISNREFTRALGRHLHRPVWLPAIPGFVLRLMLGEMADLVRYGSRVSSEAAVKNGFRFRYEYLNDALLGLPLR